jgi:hypothetical protein
MRKLLVSSIFLILTNLCSQAVFAENQDQKDGHGWAIDAKAGTLGIGVDVSRSIISRVLNLRLGYGFLAHTVTFKDDEIDYDTRFRLSAIPIALDVFPARNGFRFGAGIAINFNEAKAFAPTTGSYTLGDHKYSAQDIGELVGTVKFNRVAPYFGLGFNNPLKNNSHHLGFFTDLGILFHGTPTVRLVSSKTFPGLQTDIIKETQEISDDVKGYTILPVIQFGISYHF